jgi:hypothetical protein
VVGLRGEGWAELGGLHAVRQRLEQIFVVRVLTPPYLKQGVEEAVGCSGGFGWV